MHMLSIRRRATFVKPGQARRLIFPRQELGRGCESMSDKKIHPPCELSRMPEGEEGNIYEHP
jgi:hypothetical protein